MRADDEAPDEPGEADDPEATAAELGLDATAAPDGGALEPLLDTDPPPDDELDTPEPDAASDERAPVSRRARTGTAEQRVVLYDPLRRYLAEIRQLPGLSAEEEHALAIDYQKTGNVEAAYRLVTAQLRLVVRIAFEFKRSWLNLLDLIQEGNVGLLLAIRKFDPYRGIRLSTYASWWIRAYMIKFLLDNWRLVRVGTTNARRRLLFNLRKEKEALEAEGITPAPKLLAERLNVSEQDVIEVDQSLGVPDVSLETPTGPESDRRLGDTLAALDAPVVDQVLHRERQRLIQGKLDAFETDLDERDRAVLRDRLLAEEPATLQDLGERFGLTREGMRQVEKRLTLRLRAYLSADAAIRDLADLPRDPQAPPAPVRAAAEARPPKSRKPRPAGGASAGKSKTKRSRRAAK